MYYYMTESSPLLTAASPATLGILAACIVESYMLATIFVIRKWTTIVLITASTLIFIIFFSTEPLLLYSLYSFHRLHFTP